MKIIQVSYSLTSGGGERFIVDLSNQLSKNINYEILLLTIVDDTPSTNRHYLSELSPRVKYYNLKAKSGLSLKSFYRILIFLKKNKPDVVHIHCSSLLFYIPSLFLRNTKFILTLHSLAKLCLNFKAQKYLDKFFFKNNFIQPVTISKECHNSYVELYNLNNDTTIVNGRSQLHITTNLVKVKQEIESYKKSTNDKIFVHIARYHPVKNQQLLFKVFDSLSQSFQEFQLIVIGSGFEKCNDIPNNSHIHVLGEKKNIGDYLYYSDYFVLTSLVEGLPLSLLEAMSFGVIPITTPAGGIKDVIQNNINGFISPSFDEKDFLATIIRAINHYSINKADIIKEYKEKYSMETCSLRYQNIYSK